MIERAEVNIFSINGHLHWDEGTFPIEPNGIAVPRNWESFYVTTEMVTSNSTNDLQIAFCSLGDEEFWEEQLQVYFMPQFGIPFVAQFLPDETVRAVGSTFKQQFTEEEAYNYLIINPDGSPIFPVFGEEFFQLEHRAECATSGGSLILLRYLAGANGGNYTDASVLGCERNLHPEQPLDLDDIIGNGHNVKVVGDSVGGAFINYRVGVGEENRTYIIRVDENCQWDGVTLLPFDRLVSNFEILADGLGGALIVARDHNGHQYIQKISPENELVFDAQRELLWSSEGLNNFDEYTNGSEFLWLVSTVRTDDPEDVNVVMVSYDQEGERRWRLRFHAFEPNAGVEYRQVATDAFVNTGSPLSPVRWGVCAVECARWLLGLFSNSHEIARIINLRGFLIQKGKGVWGKP